MSQDRSKPILIVGQGIAGTVLAIQLLEAGQSVEIIDDGHRSSSSMAAAGLFNPWILKRRKLAWNAHAFLSEALPFYQGLDTKYAQDFFHPIGIWRRIHDAGEYNDWQALKSQDPHQFYLGHIAGKTEAPEALDAGLGWQEIKQSGFVDVNSFLGQTRAYFASLDILNEARFEESEVTLGDEISYAGKAYSDIVISTGYVLRNTERFFPDMPFNPAKGHTLDVRIPGLSLNQIVQGACFIIPLGDEMFRVGSTYSWHQLDEEIEEGEVEKLENLLRSFCKAEYKIERSYAGVRPATKDRKPLLGSSSIDSRVKVFGGFGSRAIMTTPLLASQMLNMLLSGASLPAEIDIKRFAG